MFITLEGIEGSGKTTQVRHIVEFLQSKGHACVATREPGGTRIGKQIRALLLDPESSDMDPMTELLLYTADRAQHVKQFVLPLLSAGKTVLCDRYYDATVVYQGYARGLDIGLIRGLHKLILKDLKPDITILLDLPPDEGLARAWKQINSGTRTGIESRFEKETLAFHEKVRSGYLELARLEPERFRVIDASKSESQVRKEILGILSSELNLTAS
ncbi:MAG: dTMP kinase [Candidatus Desulfatibia sp.]|uniref:dTMP kinase n=1 Tax=Candidatus Desulfatibia sp. TaxID=3101189 RepID=UPI002F306BC2